MSELYSEFLVKKESTFKDALIKFGMIGLTVVAVAAGLFSESAAFDRCHWSGRGMLFYYPKNRS